MKLKPRQYMLGILSFLGFLFLLGSAGALECDTISLGQFMVQAVIGLAVFGGAAYLGGFVR